MAVARLQHPRPSGIYKNSLEDKHRSSLLWVPRHAALSCLPRISVLSKLPLLPHSPSSLTTRTMQSTTRLLSNDDEQKSNPSVPNMPPHWVFEREGCTSPHTHFCWWPPFHFFHHLICVISWGHGSLVPVWEVSYPGCPPKDWKDERELVGGRLGQVNIVVRFQQSPDNCFVDFYCNFWLRLVCSFLRRLHYPPQRPLIPRCYHIRTQFPTASSGCLSHFPSLACS